MVGKLYDKLHERPSKSTVVKVQEKEPPSQMGERVAFLEGRIHELEKKGSMSPAESAMLDELKKARRQKTTTRLVKGFRNSMKMLALKPISAKQGGDILTGRRRSR